jgi:hypothetical protein
MFDWLSRILPNFTQSSSLPSANRISREVAPYSALSDSTETLPTRISLPPEETPSQDLTIPHPLLKKITRTWSILIPFEDRYLNIAPSLEKVAEYDRLTLRELVGLAKKGEGGIELLLALHRYMASEARRGVVNRLDCVPKQEGKQERRLALLVAYDEKHGVKREGNIDVLMIGRSRTPPGLYRGPV